eukprot:scaffold18444_cov54-Phaeocystis_antarctica.AAC.2
MESRQARPDGAREVSRARTLPRGNLTMLTLLAGVTAAGVTLDGEAVVDRPRLGAGERGSAVQDHRACGCGRRQALKLVATRARFLE